MKKIAIIAHDGKKPEMVNFINRNLEMLKKAELVATGTTGKHVENTRAENRKKTFRTHWWRCSNSSFGS